MLSLIIGTRRDLFVTYKVNHVYTVDGDKFKTTRASRTLRTRERGENSLRINNFNCMHLTRAKIVLYLARHLFQHTLFFFVMFVTQTKRVCVIIINFSLCFSEYYTGISDRGCPEDSHFMCADNLTCIPNHRVCDISADCPDKTDETENCRKCNA